MTIYVDDGETVKIYPVKVKVAKAVMTLLETDNELVWSTTHPGYGVEIVNKEESDEMKRDMGEIEEVINWDGDAETKCRMISDILTDKPHYFKEP